MVFLHGSPQTFDVENARTSAGAITQLIGDGQESLQNGLRVFPVVLQLKTETSFLAGIVQPDAVPHRILGIPGKQLVSADRALSHEVKIARHVSPSGLHPLLQHHYKFRR